MKKEKKEEKKEEKKILSPETNSKDSVFYPWEGGGTFLGIISSSPDKNAATAK